MMMTTTPRELRAVMIGVVGRRAEVVPREMIPHGRHGRHGRLGTVLGAQELSKGRKRVI